MILMMVQQDGLVGQAGPAVPAHEGQQIIDRQPDDQQRPFDPPEPAMDGLRIHLLAGRIKRPFDDGFAHTRMLSDR